MLALDRVGVSASAISRRTGISRTTVRNWIDGKVPGRKPRGRLWVEVSDDGEPVIRHPAAYAYLLGLYLGDGHISPMSRSMRLRVFLDSKYMGIVVRAALAIADSLPGATVSARRRKGVRMYIVSASSIQWGVLFPQHGPGPKHARDVSLRSWQSRITASHPEAFVRGLIHSDGSRFIATQVSRGHTYRYPRYCFGNKSVDITAGPKV